MAKYDVERMKNTAGEIQKEMDKFKTAAEKLDNLISQLSAVAWEDETQKRFQRVYQRDAVPVIQNVKKTGENTGKLMKECARRYSMAIDNGNTNLAQK